MKPFCKIFLFIAVFFSPAFSGYAAACTDLNIQVKDRLISMNITDQPFDCVMDQLSRKTGIHITLWKDTRKRLTLSIADLPLADFFHRLGAGNALVYSYLPEKNEYRLIAANMIASPGPDPGKKIIKPDRLLPKDKRNHNVKPDELLIRFKDTVSKDQMEQLHHFIGARILKKIDSLQLHRIKLDPQISKDTAIQMYMATGLVRSAEYHGIKTLHGFTPSDPSFPRQWGLTAIKATEAWEISQGSEDVVIAVIDTGVDYLHPDLKKNIWMNLPEANGREGVDDDSNGYIDDIYGWDFADDNDGLPFDRDGHGTHVAGIIGAVTDNSTGVAGVCPKVKLMALKVQGDDSDDMDTFDIIEAIDYARANGAHIINCSFGGDLFQAEEVTALEEFQTVNNGLIICSAGNASTNTDITPLYPACYSLPGILSVAASRETALGEYALADFSNTGATTVDVMAPGKDILSTITETFLTQAYLKVGTSPTEYMAEGFSFAATTDNNGITRALIDCGYGYLDEIPLSVNNNIALIKRGNRDGLDFYFYQKIANVQQLGAVGAIIYNNVTEDFSGTLVSPEDWIPVVSVSQETGFFIQSQIPTTITLVNQMLDSTLLYDQMSGTSMAAGFVSGAMGLLRAQSPEAPFARLKEILLNTVDIIDLPENKQLLSKGQINIFNALAQFPLAGDVNKNFKLTLEDSLLGLKTFSGKASDAVSPDISHWDINDDTKLGLPESIHVLQKKSY